MQLTEPSPLNSVLGGRTGMAPPLGFLVFLVVLIGGPRHAVAANAEPVYACEVTKPNGVVAGTERANPNSYGNPQLFTRAIWFMARRNGRVSARRRRVHHPRWLVRDEVWMDARHSRRPEDRGTKARRCCAALAGSSAEGLSRDRIPAHLSSILGTGLLGDHGSRGRRKPDIRNQGREDWRRTGMAT
jgi:hypothetical protein